MGNRIEAVDILRGFTIMAMILVNTPGDWNHVYAPLLHAEWHGLTPTDLIFPFFLFIVGISIYFAYQHKPKSITTYKKILVRSLKLIGLGLFLNLFLPYFPFVYDFETVRIPGVLQRIGIVFLISAILYLNCNWKGLLGICIIILMGYWVFLGFVPFPDLKETMPTFDRAPNNWSNYIDLRVLGSHMWKPDYDPEGFLSTLPALVSCIFGVLIGKLISSNTPKKNTVYLCITAMGLLATGYIFGNWFPINKSIWSSSFVLVSSGWAVLMLTLVYYITAVNKLKFGSIFKHVGMNAIIIYFLSSFISKILYLTKIGENNTVHSYLYKTFFTYSYLSAKMSSLIYAILIVICYSILGYVLYKKKIIIKV